MTTIAGLTEQLAYATTEVGGIPTRFATAGAAGPQVLVLHGWGAKIEAVHPIVTGLAPACRVTAVDLPGHGETGLPPEPWGGADFAAWIRAFMRQRDLDRPHVVGHSNGGRIAIHLAATTPELVGRLLLVDSAGLRPKRGFTYYRKVAMAKVGKHAARRLGAPGRALQQRLVARAASPDYAAAGEMRPTMAKLVNEDLTELLPRIQASTLLVWGSEDTATPVSDGRRMEELIPDAGLVVFEGAGHYSYLDEQQRFAVVAREFLGKG